MQKLVRNANDSGDPSLGKEFSPAAEKAAVDYDENEDLVVKYLSEANMSRKELVREECTRVRQDFALHDFDSGSSPVQVALLTVKIKALTQHMTKNRKDESSKRGLMGMLSQRKRLLKYLRKKDPEVYQDTITRLGLKDRTYVGSKYTD